LDSRLIAVETMENTHSVALEQERVRKLLVEAGETKNKKSVQIVKYIVEQIYQNLKKDLSTDDIGKSQLDRVKVFKIPYLELLLVCNIVASNRNVCLSEPNI